MRGLQTKHVKSRAKGMGIQSKLAIKTQDRARGEIDRGLSNLLLSSLRLRGKREACEGGFCGIPYSLWCNLSPE